MLTYTKITLLKSFLFFYIKFLHVVDNLALIIFNLIFVFNKFFELGFHVFNVRLNFEIHFFLHFFVFIFFHVEGFYLIFEVEISVVVLAALDPKEVFFLCDKRVIFN